MTAIQEEAFPKTLTFKKSSTATFPAAAPAAPAEDASASASASSGGGSSSAPAEEALEVDENATQMEGWLDKQGHVNKSWKKRYFVLKTGRLEYYTNEPSEEGSNLQGVIPLTGSTLYSLQEPPCAFVVQAIDPSNGSKKAYPIRAANDASRECWVELCRLHGSDALMTGWLVKQGHIIPSWRKRWFVLEPPCKLHYFTSPAGEWKGTIQLKGATITPSNANPKLFQVHTLSGEDKDFSLKADSSGDRDQWVRSCRSVTSGEEEEGEETINNDEGPEEELGETPPSPSQPKPPAPSRSVSGSSRMFPSFFSKKKSADAGAAGVDDGMQEREVQNEVNLEDFTLMKVVGKGAFGKVMMCRKKVGDDAGQIYAVKVLIKSVIAAKKQVEHTKSERKILMEINHPFIVRLRYAFQSEDKLYLVTDYYNGGSLFYHLRKSRCFPENRARFYAAELMLAIEHLHQHGIIYRDLKLENILMDHQGHIALTDFGLSKENVVSVFAEQLKTFCGTAEYIAPELLKGMRYGAAVDWWSFGILIYEMLNLKTPFYDKNRKLMFHSIINQNPKMPKEFTPEAKNLILQFLNKDAKKRLGCGEDGADQIMGHPFFASIDWDELIRRESSPPFRPDVSNEQDTKYVPSAYLKLEAKDSICKPPAAGSAGASARGQWDDFTYVTGSPMDNSASAEAPTAPGAAASK